MLKRACGHASPRWVSVSSVKDGVDGGALDEHRQSFLSKIAPAQHLCCLSVGVLVPHFLISTGQLHTCQGYTSMLPHSGNTSSL